MADEKEKLEIEELKEQIKEVYGRINDNLDELLPRKCYIKCYIFYAMALCLLAALLGLVF